MRATYSPDDNKLRLYADGRLPPELYERVRAAGFRWAPQQELFVAPMWTPERADLLIELCGEIGDDDTSLTDRAEERAERFEEYSEHRAEDAQRAADAVKTLADGIPLGQPILVGHHSEKRARKDAEKIRNGMTRAVKMWETSAYWTSRAAGALRHAKYKELPNVRARRIKTIEADKRKQERTITESTQLLTMWRKPLDTPGKDGIASPRRRAIALANLDRGYWSSTHEYRRRDETGREIGDVYHTGPMTLWEAAGGNTHDYDPDVYAIATPEEIRGCAVTSHEARIAWAQRWIDHYDLRLTYERALLGEAGGTVADRTAPEKGGAVRCWATQRGSDRWSTIVKVNKVTITVLDNWGNGGDDFTRPIKMTDLRAVISKAAVDTARAAGRIADETPRGFVLLSEECIQTSDKPLPNVGDDVPTSGDTSEREGIDVDPLGYIERAAAEVVDDAIARDYHERGEDRVCPDGPSCADPICQRDRAERGIPVETTDTLNAFREALKTGVQVVSAPQLFPTPPAIARQVVALADIQPGMMVLEPSAGTGNIAAIVREVMAHCDVNNEPAPSLLCIEVNGSLVDRLQRFGYQVHRADFLTCNGDLGTFDRIVMNPPFSNADDIKHIQHARRMLKPGGRLVAVCANGPRQQAQLKPEALEWIDLPAGSFEGSGTGVNTVIVVMESQR